ncbi:hypothetical protein CNYM01_03677 [Colletotrichum nymphaeae SA-01]|uniref:Methyltransferase domain-containing protein n=1 Tax=Colletotrichum nymphaeae SA-01 TaxID=1460502 RepID=A0A135UR02_9PEZI|nr:hypothetical protein CNYM01_03677 [Colletotrichum nymphaeae SA-01]
MADEPTPELPAHRTPTDRDTNSPFWTETLPPLEEHTKRLFIEYAKIPEDKIHEHLEEAFPKPDFQRSTNTRPLSLSLSQRKKAWNDCPYPCIGLWLFLKLQLRNNKKFDEAVRRTQRGENLLDFGCAVGQDLRPRRFIPTIPPWHRPNFLLLLRRQTPLQRPSHPNNIPPRKRPLPALNPPLRLAQQLLHHNRKLRPALLQPTRPRNLRRLSASSILGKTKRPDLRPHGGHDGRRGAEGRDAQGPEAISAHGSEFCRVLDEGGGVTREEGEG